MLAPRWPSNKPLPRFASEEEELAFWKRHDVPWNDEAQWEEVAGPVVAIGGTKPQAIRVVLAPLGVDTRRAPKVGERLGADSLAVTW
jgi:hypothetical protein